MIDAAAQGLPFVIVQNGSASHVWHQTRKHGGIQNAPGNHHIDSEQPVLALIEY